MLYGILLLSAHCSVRVPSALAPPPPRLPLLSPSISLRSSSSQRAKPSASNSTVFGHHSSLPIRYVGRRRPIASPTGHGGLSVGPALMSRNVSPLKNLPGRRLLIG